MNKTFSQWLADNKTDIKYLYNDFQTETDYTMRFYDFAYELFRETKHYQATPIGQYLNGKED